MNPRETITKQIHGLLERERRINLHRFPIHISNADGVAVLEGEVGDVAAKKLALELAASVSDVRGVVDRLRVAPGERRGDGAIRDSLARLFLEHAEFRNCTLRSCTNERTEVLRDPRSGFVAYAPMGSVKKGQTLVTTGGNGKTIACGTCHGTNLEGTGPVPGIGGRSPSYLVRQMYDMQTGARKGSWSELMKPVVAKLTPEDFVSIAAYVASRPQAAAPASQTAGR